jgi:hypothetical protein
MAGAPGKSTLCVLAALLAPSIARAARDRGVPGARPRSSTLVRDYKPSRATGWETPYTPTIGGHRSSEEITYHHARYRVALLGFGQTSRASNAVYEALPTDPDVAFKQTLGRTWHRYYDFRYRGACPAAPGS